MNAEELRAGLERAAAKRTKADRLREEGAAEAAQLLRQVAMADFITMREAAAILGVSRVQAYRIMDQAPRDS